MEYGTLFRRLLRGRGRRARARAAPSPPSRRARPAGVPARRGRATAFVLSGSGRLRLNARMSARARRGDISSISDPECEHVVTSDQGEEPLVVLFLWWGQRGRKRGQGAGSDAILRVSAERSNDGREDGNSQPARFHGAMGSAMAAAGKLCPRSNRGAQDTEFDYIVIGMGSGASSPTS